MTNPHRLPPERYLGFVNVSVTQCLNKPVPIFLQAVSVERFVPHLTNALTMHDCRRVYCFMPEHLHVVLMGQTEYAQPLRAIELFKQSTGHWFHSNSQSLNGLNWQRSFWTD